MKISARNVLKGKIIKVTKGAVNTEVLLELPGGDQVVSMISKESATKLGLKSGKTAYAVIKASNVMIAVD
ncbi:MAG TPA: molybdopterin-binding protein [Syntrophales bacterium]|nr:molybdopterin-binding protein [Syntrophales bacterium]